MAKPTEREMNESLRREEEWRRDYYALDPITLGDPMAFSDEPPGPEYFASWPDHDPKAMGADSEAVWRRLCQSCCGWPTAPTGLEFYRAVRAEKPTDRQKCLISMWIIEASRADLFDAWGEHVYTWRELVTAFHRVEYLNAYKRRRELNQLAMTPEYNGVKLWTR